MFLSVFLQGSVVAAYFTINELYILKWYSKVDL